MESEGTELAIVIWKVKFVARRHGVKLVLLREEFSWKVVAGGEERIYRLLRIFQKKD